MGQVTSYYKGDDGFFYGKYNESELGVEGLKETYKNKEFGPVYKIVSPGALYPLFHKIMHFLYRKICLKECLKI